ncbi:hypothetical protein ACM9HO_07195, partial [Pseudomonas sp. KHB2.9]
RAWRTAGVEQAVRAVTEGDLWVAFFMPAVWSFKRWRSNAGAGLVRDRGLSDKNDFRTQRHESVIG